MRLQPHIVLLCEPVYQLPSISVMGCLNDFPVSACHHYDPKLHHYTITTINTYCSQSLGIILALAHFFRGPNNSIGFGSFHTTLSSIGTAVSPNGLVSLPWH